nr:SAM-dependent methyltransferase [Frankia nepalensis]
MTEDLSASSSSGPDEAANPPFPIDTSVPHSARIWNYWLGGTDCYPVDQAAGEEYLTVFPGIAELAPRRGSTGGPPCCPRAG